MYKSKLYQVAEFIIETRAKSQKKYPFKHLVLALRTISEGEIDDKEASQILKETMNQKRRAIERARSLGKEQHG